MGRSRQGDGKRQAASSRERDVDLRGEVRRLRKQIAQLKRALEKAQGVAAWGWLEDGDEETDGERRRRAKEGAISPPELRDSADEGKILPGLELSPVCPKCKNILITLTKPDGSQLTRCGNCRSSTKRRNPCQ